MLFLFQTEMVRNYLNFIKSKLKFRCLKENWGFWRTSRKKVIPHSPGIENFSKPRGIEKVIPHSSRKKIQ